MAPFTFKSMAGVEIKLTPVTGVRSVYQLNSLFELKSYSLLAWECTCVFLLQLPSINKMNNNRIFAMLAGIAV